MFRALIFAFFVFYSSTAFATDLKDLQWYSGETPNFVIFSIEQKHLNYLQNHIEEIKNWVLTRWGFPEIKFEKPCKILCVPNASLLKELFDLDESSASESMTKDGKFLEMVLFLNLEGQSPNEIIPSVLTQVCLKEIERQFDVKFQLWQMRGMAILNQTPAQIRKKFLDLDKSKLLTASSIISESKPSPEFDVQAAVFSLMIRKELGRNAFFEKDWGYRPGELDLTFKRYTNNVLDDLKSNKTPKSYLRIKGE